jgi:methylation protein EvaC
MVAKEKGINTTINFFDKDLAQKIVKGYGQASAFIAANVMCHIPYIKSIVEGIEVLLRPNGVVIFEEPYLGEVIDKTTYDQIYDEHTFLFSAHSVKYLFGQYGMELINLEPQTTHGGSMRYTIAKKGARTVNKIVCDILENEEDQGLNDPKTYLQFKQNCEHYRIQLVNLLEQIRKKGKSISGYAATSKSTTITNYCEITSDLIDCIYDSTPIKQGKFNPGTHIPIRPHQEFKENYPDYAVLFGYNHSKEIFAKEHDFIEQGGKWIVYVPQIEII